MIERSEMTNDDISIQKARTRLLQAYSRLGTWRKVEDELGVDHGIIIALVKHGKVPTETRVRVRLGLPKVMPSERKPRVRKVIPLLGSAEWLGLAFKKIRLRRKR
jgi:hypothetical protein